MDIFAIKEGGWTEYEYIRKLKSGIFVIRNLHCVCVISFMGLLDKK